MSASTTSRLGLVKPSPGTGELVNVATQINASYDKIDDAIGAAPCTSTTRPVSPFHGQIIRETDTRRLYAWNATNSAWDQIATAGPGRLRASLDVDRDTSGQGAINTYVSGDTNPRMSVLGSGFISWGPGNAAADVNLYRESAGVLKSDDTLISSGVAVTSDTTNSAAIQNVETVIATITNYTFLPGVAYEVKFFQPLISDIDGRLALFKVHKTNLAGADWGEFFRFRASGSAVMNATGERYLIRTAGTSLTTSVVLTLNAPEITVSAGTHVTARGNVANSPRWFMIRPCGIATEYVGMATVVA